MRRYISQSHQQSFPRSYRVLFVCICVIALLALSGCGSSSSSGSSTRVPEFSGTTRVTVQLSSTANARLAGYWVDLQNVTLTDQKGNAVTVFNSPVQAYKNFPEFMHLNGGAEPLATVSVPQQVYTSASVALYFSEFQCVALDPNNNSLHSSYYEVNIGPTSATVNLPAPITISGEALNLELDLQVAQSYTMASCISQGISSSYSITPVFNLTPVKLAAQPTSTHNGLLPQVEGQITAINTTANSLSLTLAGGQAVTVSAVGTTAYEGVSGLASLTVGTMIITDLVTQADGSLQASRIAVLDPAALAIAQGPLLFVSASEPVAYLDGRDYEGSGFFSGGGVPFSFGNAAFQVIGGYSNLQKLPFAPVFSASNMVPGQQVYVSTRASSMSPEPIYYPASTVTLMPQTINGRVIESGTSGDFATYTVVLAAYDLFPNLASQPGQTTVVTSPSTVMVYADNNTRMLNSSTIAAGSMARFYGLVFNDNGTLRMDCAQISDGVAQ